MTGGVISILTWRACAQAHDSPLGCLRAAENTIPKQWNDSRTLISGCGYCRPAQM